MPAVVLQAEAMDADNLFGLEIALCRVPDELFDENHWQQLLTLRGQVPALTKHSVRFHWQPQFTVRQCAVPSFEERHTSRLIQNPFKNSCNSSSKDASALRGLMFTTPHASVSGNSTASTKIWADLQAALRALWEQPLDWQRCYEVASSMLDHLQDGDEELLPPFGKLATRHMRLQELLAAQAHNLKQQLFAAYSAASPSLATQLLSGLLQQHPLSAAQAAFQGLAAFASALADGQPLQNRNGTANGASPEVETRSAAGKLEYDAGLTAIVEREQCGEDAAGVLGGRLMLRR